MDRKPKESDWKIFKVIKQQALEEYCRHTLAEAQRIISDSSASSHDGYLELYRHIQKCDKQLGNAFDPHSRSRAPMQLMLLRKLGLVPNEALSKLSAEMQESTKPFLGRQKP